MGTIIFEGEPPFELLLQKAPRAFAEGRYVVLSLPVFLPDAPGQTVETRVILSQEHAKHVLGSLPSALTMAEVNERQGQ